MRRQGRYFAFAIVLGALLSVNAGASEMENVSSRWEFSVYIDQKKVGKHVFEVTERDGTKMIESRADFQYKVLFIPVYRYQHRNAERWVDDCLVELAAQTNANGERFEVRGERIGNRFRVDRGDEQVRLPGCVMTFAYWNPRFMRESRLLNPQTGEYVEVNVERLAPEPLEVHGETVATKRFRLTAYQLNLTLWYSDDDRWLALESVVEGGHIIRYELS